MNLISAETLIEYQVDVLVEKHVVITCQSFLFLVSFKFKF